jgi:regulator of cell morphogenesis and NO signaling
MELTKEKTVRQIALESSTATRIFEQFGIDYCCGGNRPLEQACQAAKINFEQVLDALDLAQQSNEAVQPNRDWQSAPLSDLIAHIERKHHTFVRSEIERLGPLFDKVCGVHGKTHTELLEARSVFDDLRQELTMHLMKEEKVLFPYVRRLEEARLQKEPIAPAPFGSVRHPISMMEHEHDSAGEALRSLRSLTSGYTAPEEACVSYKALYRALAEFEADLHQHIHLENNILFPRATEMERTA